MDQVKVILVFVLLCCGACMAQEQGACYGAGSLAGAIVGTLLVTLALVAIGYVIWRVYWRSRRGKHLVLVTDPETTGDQYAFDNPCFKDGTPIGGATLEKESGKLEHKGKWSPWGQLGNLVGPRTIEKRRALDDSCVGDPQVNVIALRSHDFTGLGFNICGNMRDGIFVKDVLHRGPASESGRIAPGDRIEAIRISFRHMVFEDALTILSYASPYDVQLEVENTSSSRPSTLIRTKRTSGSSISAADRICHPFYRSQSIADLAQIGKASLKRLQQQQQHMGSMPRSPRAHQNEGGSEYPTLKLSPGTTNKKEQLRLDKAAAAPAVIVVKPERAKKDQDSLSRLQKFGVRVLPDTAATGTNPSQQQQHSTQGKQAPSESARKQVESELHENEHNSKIEQVATGETSRPQQPFTYDERAIDVGPVESPKAAHLQQHGGAEETSTTGGDNNVKHLLSKGLQNIKEKLHNDKTKKPLHMSESPEPSETHTYSGEGEIPTEIPEEVQRAAMAARSNRKPSGNLENTMSVARKRTESSGSSSAASDAAGSGSADDGRRTPNKKHNKRKAPPPPAEGEDEVDTSKQQDNGKPQESSNDESKRPLSLDANIKLMSEGDKMPNITSELPKHHRDSDAASHEVTNITLDGKSVNSMSAVESALSVVPTSSMTHKQSSSGNGGVSDSDSDMEHLEGDIDDDSYEKKMKKGGTTIELNSSHITIHHSPSPATSSDNVTTTTTTTAVVGAGDESTRKAASLGDLSRLDYSEQPMSILERAVSLDLADNGNVTPSLGGVGGGKKRKAPLPPGDPVADYLLQDGDSGEFLLHRKEPRLDSAMDTFQRRRLKKSSDWGTLEEALLQSDDGKATLLVNKDKSSSTSSSPASAPAPSPSTTIPSESPQTDSTQQPAESTADNEASPTPAAGLMNSHHHHHYETIALSPQLFGAAGITRMDILGDYDEPHYSSSVSDDKKVAQEEVQQKTVLCITPEPTNTEQPHSLGSQVTIASNENIGSLGLGINAETDMAKFASFSSSNSNPEADQSMDNFPSPSQSMSAIVSSTPITSHLSTNSYPTNVLQSSIVTSSSFSGVSSVHVSSTVPPFDVKEQTHDSDFNDALAVSSNGSNSTTADTTSMNTQFVTAVDSTMVPEANETQDGGWVSEDSPPPELPTSPVPVLSHHITSFRPSTSSLSTSPSMTYITEIQVVTTNDRAHESPSTLSVESKSSLEEMDSPPPPPPPLPQTTSINAGLLKYVTGSDSNSAITNATEINSIESVGNSPSSVISSTIQNCTLGPAPFKGNVTVTSIRNPERSRIPMRIVTTATERVISGTNNHPNHPIFSVSNKPARPPVPPRKSESLVENIHIRPNVSKLTTFASQQQQPQSEENSNVGRNSSSFEQWVFLDEGQNGGLESGDELSSSGVSHSTVVSLTPVTRAQSVTHIVLDTSKQTNGDHGKP